MKKNNAGSRNAYEREDGRVSFRYDDLVLGRIGARYNVQLREAKSKLEDVHLVIPHYETLTLTRG